MRTGKVREVRPNGQWNGMNKYQVTLEDNSSWTFFAKAEFKKAVGDEIKFEVTNAEYGNAKLVKEYMAGGGTFNRSASKDQQIIRQTCIKAAAEFNAERTVGIEQVLQDAETLLNWVNGVKV